MIKKSTLYELADFFSVFSGPTRICILYELSLGEKCVSCLSEKLEMTQSSVSHQLKQLKQANLVKSRREGKQNYYSLTDMHIRTILETALIHIIED